jgi:hypothetical protein
MGHAKPSELKQTLTQDFSSADIEVTGIPNQRSVKVLTVFLLFGANSISLGDKQMD